MKNIATDKNFNIINDNKVKDYLLQAEFVELTGELQVNEVLTERGDVTGFAISIGEVFLERNRGGLRTFKSLDSVNKFRKDMGFKEFVVRD